MRIKFWLASILESFWIRPSRAKRRWMNKQLIRPLAAVGLAVGVSTSLISSAAVAQCDGPLLFLGLEFAVGEEPESIVTGDFNGDGLADLATANFISDDVSVLLGNGDGTLAAPQTFLVGDGPGSCLLYTSPSPRDRTRSRMPSSA